MVGSETAADSADLERTGLRLGRLQAHSFSYSGNPQGCDHVIRHLHTANPQGRVFPQKWEEFDYAPFFANLRAIGYAGRISVEGSTTDLAGQGPVAVALLHKAFER